MPSGETTGPTLQDWWPVVAPYLGACFEERTSLEHLEKLGASLPGHCRIALEVRLASEIPDIDISIQLPDPQTGALLAATLGKCHASIFLDKWLSGAWIKAVRSVWLEFDLARNGRNPIFCAEIAEGATTEQLDDIARDLHGSADASTQRSLLRHCLAAIPHGARPLYLFSLSPRGIDAIRLEILGLPIAGMPDYLRRIGGPHLAEQVEQAGEWMGEVERPHLSLDLGDEISTRVGLEGSFRKNPGREPRWSELLERWVAGGLCRPEERDALLGWTGWDSLFSARDRWPIFESGAVSGFCVRALSHLKLVTWPDRPPEAKAYLLIQHLPRRRRESPRVD